MHKKYKKLKWDVVAGGCSFTFGNELSDDTNGKTPSEKTWAALIAKEINANYHCVAKPGGGNGSITRRVIEKVGTLRDGAPVVVAMWTFPSRYDWAFPRHKNLDDSRWTTITPWDTSHNRKEVENAVKDSEPQFDDFIRRQQMMQETGLNKFADALYTHAANYYFEIYQSWMNIICLQNFCRQNGVPFFFTLADNTLFYEKLDFMRYKDVLMDTLWREIDMRHWHWFGERFMGFNQWALLNDYKRGTTHPLDQAHIDGKTLMMSKFKEAMQLSGLSV